MEFLKSKTFTIRIILSSMVFLLLILMLSCIYCINKYQKLVLDIDSIEVVELSLPFINAVKFKEIDKIGNDPMVLEELHITPQK